MRRVSVVGCPGSGKSTLGRKVATQLDVPFVELDGIFHQPGWQELPRDEFRARVSEQTASDGWVIDGNYNSAVQDLVWARADTVVWIDLPRSTVMRRVIRRTVRRAVRREELWNGNREPMANFYRWSDKNIILWAWTHYPSYRERYLSAMTDPSCSHLDFIHLRSPQEIDALAEGAT